MEGKGSGGAAGKLRRLCRDRKRRGGEVEGGRVNDNDVVVGSK